MKLSPEQADVEGDIALDLGPFNHLGHIEPVIGQMGVEVAAAVQEVKLVPTKANASGGLSYPTL